MANPDSHVEGEEAVQNSEMEVEELKWLEAFCQKLFYHLDNWSRGLEVLLIKLSIKFSVPYPASMTKGEGEMLNEIE